MNDIKKSLLHALMGVEEWRAVDAEGETVLNKTLVEDLARECDCRLLDLLMQNSETRAHFFTRLSNGALVFKRSAFIMFLENREFLPDSFTAFTQKIGLGTDEKHFLQESKDVVLNFPFKDCVLVGGQTKDDQKRGEKFYNTILAPDECACLKDEKVFTNFKRYTKSGEEKVTELKPADNLIIKGNNYFALNCLKKRFAGKVKLIYIDPPYNTGSDSFGYNDRFNHSSWLVFMKNRLEIAKELLRNDGSIFIQCDDNEQAYLKVLCDEVFGRENFVNCIVVKMSEATGVKMAHQGKRLPKLKEYVLMYKKENISLNEIRINKEQWDNEYNIYLKNVNEKEIKKLKEIRDNENRTINDTKTADATLSKAKPCSINDLYRKNEISTDEKKIEFNFLNAWRIVRSVSVSGSGKKLADKKKKNVKADFFSIVTPQKKMYFMKNNYDESIENPRIKILFADDYLQYNPCDMWTDIKTTGLDNEGCVDMKNGKKPEDLLARIIMLSTNPGDIVLDYHLGSGTTAAVAHKMGRQYIGVEQMDYIESVTVERMKKVIAGEQGGVSKAVGWQGGGDFVYCELAKKSQALVDSVNKADSKAKLRKLFDEIMASPYLNYRVTSKEFLKIKISLSKNKSEKQKLQKTLDSLEGDFMGLSEDLQKELLVSMIDANTLCVNYSEIDDEQFHVSDEDKKLNREFYGRK